MIAEHYASSRIKKEQDLSWSTWGKRLNEYSLHVDRLFSPDLILLGGGVSRKYDKYKAYLDLSDKIKPAQLQNRAGTIGAAVYAAETLGL